MKYKDISVQTIVNKITSDDNLFGGNYTVDPYQNCEFSCLYCDSSIDSTVYIKANALEIFEKEINKLEKGRIILGSVHDPYQKIEESKKITRKILKIIKNYDFPVHILTKSTLVLRDIDIISEIKDSMVTISLISLKSELSNIFEKKVPSPYDRLKTIKILQENNINSGIAIIPIIPYLVEDELENIIKEAKTNNAKYILYKNLELKGDQKQIFFSLIQNQFPYYLEKYKKLFNENYKPEQSYISNLNDKIKILCKKYELPSKTVK